MSVERSSVLTDLVKSLAALASLYAGSVMRRAATTIGGYIVVGILLAISLCFLTFAGYRALSLTLGSINASLIVGSAYLFVALLATVVLQFRR